MQKNNKFFEDIAKFATSAGGAFVEWKNEVENLASAQVDKVLRRMDLVTREEFNALREVAIKARLEQEKLEKRLAELEKSATPKAAPKTAAKTTAKPAVKAAAPKAAKKATSAKKPAAKPATKAAPKAKKPS